MICVSEFTMKLAAAMEKLTLLVAVKPLPVMVTTVPTGPLVGVKEVITGTTVTTKLDELVAVPAGLVTWIAPDCAPVGTVAVICVLEFTVKLAAVPAKVTAVVPVKLLPVMVTLAPTGPFVGVKEVMEGATITTKLDELAPVPAEFVTWILPVLAPAGTVVVICVSETRLKLATTDE